MASQTARRASMQSISSGLSRPMRRFLTQSGVTLFALTILLVFLMPFAYMLATAFKDKSQISNVHSPIWPAEAATYTYQGKEYPLYQVPTESGVREWALIIKRREESSFIDPANPEAGLIVWKGRWRTLDQVWKFSPHEENFPTAWKLINFPLLMRNTLAIAILGTIGTLMSSIAVAYGFSRFRIPGKGILFTILMVTIILPKQVTLVPTYALFSRIGWVGTWLPLIVPHFFSNAFNVFLLRQYFMTIPREIDEAAMLDGANPLQTLIWVIVPQSLPAVTAVGLFHFFYAWNDFFEPLIYLSTKPNLQPISIGLYAFNFTYSRDPHMIQATALMGLILPVIVFFMAQRMFMQGVVVTGVEK